MMYIELKDGLVFKTKAKNEIELWLILNDAGFFITLEGIGNINKVDIKRTFPLWSNPILEAVAKHPYHEQVVLQSIMRSRAKDGKRIKSYIQLIEIYRDSNKSFVEYTTELPFYLQDELSNKPLSYIE